MDREAIKNFCAKGAVDWKTHALTRIAERGISQAEAEAVLMSGEIIENYPNDYPYPSCLMIGEGRKPLHVVCALSPTEVIIVTAYYPNILKWNPDYKTRKEQL